MVIPVGGDSESYSNEVSLELYINRKSAFFFYPRFCNPWCNQLSADTISEELSRSRSLIKVVRQFHEAGFMVDVNDDPGATLSKKIRSAQLAQYNYIFGKDG